MRHPKDTNMPKKILVLSLLATSVITAGIFLSFTTEAQEGSDVSIEYNATSQVYTIWNENDNYYIDSVSGMQLTNHYEEYWSHNVWCAVVGGTKYCADSFSWTWEFDTDNATYANLTGYATIKPPGHELDIEIEYYIMSNETSIRITPTVHNIKKDVTGYFVWRIQDIQINMSGDGDVLLVNDDIIDLNDSLNLEYPNNVTNLTFKVIDAATHEALDFWWNDSIWIDGANQTHDYTLKVISEVGQYNAPIELWTYVGLLADGSTFSASYRWHDAFWDSKALFSWDDDTNPDVTSEILDGSSDKPDFSGTLDKFAIKCVVSYGKGLDAGDGMACEHCETVACSDSLYVGEISGTAYNAEGTYWINSTSSALLDRIEHDGAESEFLRCYAVGPPGPGEDLTVDVVTVHFDYTPLPGISGEATNDSETFAGETVNHTATITDATHYLFSWNGSGASCDEWVNTSWLSAGNPEYAFNETDIPTACEGKMIGWRFWGNSTDGKTQGSLQTYQVWEYGELHVEITSPDDDSEIPRNTTFYLNATVNCTGGEFAKCGDVDAYARYGSGSPDSFMSIYEGEQPMYIQGGGTEENITWDVVDDEGDGTADSIANCIGDFSSGIYLNSSIGVKPNQSILVHTISLYIAEFDGSDYLSDVNVWFCELTGNSACSYTNCIIVNSSWDVEWVVGWQNISITDTSLEVNEYGYVFLLETGNSDNDGISDSIFCGRDTSTSDNRFANWYNSSSCSDIAHDYAQIKLYGSESGTSNPQPLGTMSSGDTLYPNWTVNATGASATQWELDVFFNSSLDSDVASNHTGDRTVCVDSCAGAADTGFNITWTDNGYTISADGCATADTSAWFNDTDGNDRNVNATLEGSNWQTLTYAQINFTNEGDTALKIHIGLDTALPSYITLFGSLDNDPYTGTFDINNSVWAIANSSVGTGESEQVWVWANFTDAWAVTTKVNLYINSSAA